MLDLIFAAKKHPSKARVEGYLIFNSTGSRYFSYSGSKTLKPLPNGVYCVKNLHLRKDMAMHLDVSPKENGLYGLCFPPWSVDLEPVFPTERNALRIHPDGHLPGTEGCIGIRENVDKCFDNLKTLLSGKSGVLLKVDCA